MRLTIIVTCCSFLCTLAIINSSAAGEVNDEQVKKLLQQIPELPIIPTKNGYYIFVSSQPCNCDSKQTPSTQPSTPKGSPSSRTSSTSQKPITNPSQFKISQMRGVNRAGLEYSCVKGFGIFDGPNDDASIQAIKKWKAEVVRIPLNEDCWLGINGVNSALSGDNYRNAVTDYVKRLRNNGLKVIIDLHWTDGIYGGAGQADCYDITAKCQKPMPDAENAPRFWQSVANQFKYDDSIIFDLFNNPFPDKAIQDKTSAWKCWRNGGNDCSGFQFKVAGMQDLVNAVRSTGANNPLMVGGLNLANDLSKWLENVPNDPNGKIIASWHSFKESSCSNEQCWESEIAPIAKKYPIIVGEIGERGCSHTYIDKLMDWLDKKGISYLGWTWNTWDCSSGPSLISDYNGTPTEFGKGLYNRMNGVKSSTQPSGGSSMQPSGGSSTKPSGGSSNKPSGGSSTQPSGGSSGTSGSKSAGRQLRGVNRSGAEYSCVKNFGIFEGPVDDNAIKTMKTWNINVVRVPLNEDCWLNINGHNAAYSGEKYRKAVIDYVALLRKNNLNVILDLHWSDGIYGGPGQGECYDKTAKCQKPMPDKENAPKFWQDVAKQFKDDEGIIFDLFNEPFPDMVIKDKTAAWKCLRDGGSACPGFQYEVAGMQDLVNAVRSTGAKNLVMVGGITWTNDLSRWQEYKPNDSANNTAASWHSYNFNPCNTINCWETQVAPVAAKYPVIVGEIGEHGCTHSYIDGLMDWLDKKKISYVGWTWNVWDCSSGPSLIKDYNGTPTDFGVGLKDHLASSSGSDTSSQRTGASTSGGSSSSGSGGTASSNKRAIKSQLRGVNRSGAEYSCVKNLGIFEGPVDDNAIKTMKKWNISVVRIPLNEDCWLGINGHTAAYNGENYRNAVINYVNLLRKNDLSVILDLHWSGGLYGGAGRGECYDQTAKCQKPMPHAENSPKFWKSVAKQFSGDDNIIFDLFNEPFPDMVFWDKPTVWKCWRDGGSACPGFPYSPAGMQDLVNAVREVGAKNPVMVGGINWSSDLSLWKQYVPNDPLNKIVASWHAYALNPCNNTNCWESMISPIAKDFSVIVGEMGETDCTHQYIDQLMAWLDKNQISYLGWTWNTWDCRSGPALITNYDGTPSDFGRGLLNHLTGNDAASTPGKNNPDKGRSGTSSSNSGNKPKSTQLRGVNRSGSEYSCVKNLGIFEGPVDDSAVKTMKNWNINVVRVPLNEDCWLGINGHTASYIGNNYQNAVINYVNLLRKNDLTVILDLHWTDGIYGGPGQGDCYDKAAKCQKPMPDKENAPKFWQAVAKQFMNDDGIIFDLFNEPFPDMVINDKRAAWKCLRDGGSACPGFQYEVAGMQDLVNAVRSTGAKNLVMVGGLTWTNDLSRWLEYVPNDSANSTAASWHSYNFNSCNNKDCWDTQIAPVAAKYPVIVGEIGEHGCTHSYIDGLMDWLDQKKISYLGWTWNTWDCSSGPSLIQDYNGTPTEFGKGLKNHLKP